MRGALVPDPAELLTVYDSQLRGESEVLGAVSWDQSGPLWRAKFDDGGFVGYRDLDGYEGTALDRLISETVEYFAEDPAMGSFEWKTRGHDRPDDLPDRLVASGLEPEELETVMIGEAASLSVDVELPEGVALRRVDNLPDRAELLDAAARMQAEVFGRGGSGAELLARVDSSEGRAEVWVAEAEGQVVSAGRLEMVSGTEFAGLWGGATLAEWRGRGIYRALTSARARSALARGARFLQSDCSPMSRPILERSGLVAVTTTTPYVWSRS